MPAAEPPRAATDHTIRTSRLDLVPLPGAALEALIAHDAAAASALLGVALPPDLGRRAQALLMLRLADLRQHPGAGQWLLRVIALRTDAQRPMIGLSGFHGPPDTAGAVEVGYEIVAAHRRHGYATEATAALTAWALTDGAARRVVAAIRPDNEASLAVVRRLGFAAAGSRWDAVDGTALLFERRSPPVAPDGAKMPTHRSAGTEPGHSPEARPMTDDAEISDIYPERSAGETRSIGQRLRAVLGAHRVDPADPEHRCLCGWDGESYDDHLAWSTLRDMKEVGYEVWPTRH